jgi:DNA-binding NarL/FixJ family response regulator
MSQVSVAVLPERSLEGDLLRLLLETHGVSTVPPDRADVVLVVADQLAAAAQLSSTCPVVVVVRSGHAGDIDLARRVGANGCVAWEDDPAALLAAVDRAAGGRSAPLPAAAPTADQDPLASLTAREQDILALASLGCRNRDIATALGISTHTVRTHMQNLMGKLGVAHRHAAGAQALRSPLLRGRVNGWAQQIRAREDASLCAS